MWSFLSLLIAVDGGRKVHIKGLCHFYRLMVSCFFALSYHCILHPENHHSNLLFLLSLRNDASSIPSLLS